MVVDMVVMEDMADMAVMVEEEGMEDTLKIKLVHIELHLLFIFKSLLTLIY